VSAWALVLVLTMGDQPIVSWHEDEAACHRRAPVEIFHAEVTGRPVAHAFCQRARTREPRGLIVR
jgi:hypothetical protein